MFRAAQQIHLEEVPIIIKDVNTDEVLELALIENIQREDLNPVEEALAYKDLISQHQYTQDELAKRLGKDRSSIANTLRLLKLPEEIRSHIISDELSMGHARALLGIDNKELQKKVADEIIKNGLSVREIESWIRRLKDDFENNDASVSTRVKRTQIEKKEFKDLEESLKKHFKTKVQIKNKGEKGKLIIHYHSEEELKSLFEMLMA